MASALFKLSSDGGSTYLTAGTALADDEALAYNAAGSYSIKAALDSTAGVDTVQWSITSADDVNIASLPAVTQNADKTCEFSVTKAGGAWLLRCIVNGGVNALTGKTDPALVRALAVKVLNSAGQQEVAVGESSEAGPYGWTKAHNDVARAGGGGGITESQLRTAAAALTASLDVNGQKIVDLGTPTASTDAATKGYVDGLITTLDLKASVRVATTGGLISLSGEQTIDGVSAVAGDRVLVKNQEVASLNGIYVVAAGAWSRATDADSSAEVTCGMFCFVEEGTTNGGTGWLLTTANPITLGVTGLLFQKFTNTALDEPGFRALAATLAADLDVNTQKITSVADPTDPQDAATKASSEAAATAAAQNEANLRAAAAALGNDLDVNGVEVTNLANPTADTSAASAAYVKDYTDGYTTLAIGSTSVSLSASDLTTGQVKFTGTLTGDTTVTMPSGLARSVWLINGTSGTYTLKVAGSSSGSTYLMPGQARRVAHDSSGVLRCEAPRVLNLDLSVTVNGDAVGNNDHTLCKIPAYTVIDRAEVIVSTAITGGTATFSVGDSGSYNQLMGSTPVALASIGDYAGDGTSEAGSGFASALCVKYTSAATLALRCIVSTSTLTAGVVRVFLVGRYVGE